MQQENDIFSHYRQWSAQVTDILTEYRDWRSASKLDTEAVSRAMRHCQPQIQLVVTGEFGRGKTEFINALLAQSCGERLLPVRIGRATMTPLEIAYDGSEPSLRLLPIESRLDHSDLATKKLQTDTWQHHALDTSDTAAMRLLLQEVAKTKAVTLARAEQLGFDITFLETCQEQTDHVMVPAWQHALVNLDFPLFRQGLSLVDTPGFNALGMESMLSEDIIASGQAHLHVLSIETGVTASDYHLWKKHILPASSAQHMPLFVLINKLDLLDQEEEPVVNSLNRIKRIGAKQFDLPDTHFYALSAKFANQGIKNRDEVLRKRSGLDHFQDGFFPTLVNERITRLQNGLITPLTHEIDTKMIALGLEIKRLEKDHAKLVNTQSDVEQNYLQTKESIASEEKNIAKQQSLLAENMRDIDLSYEHIMHIFSDAQFTSHQERAKSILSDDSNKNVSEEVAKARNILLAGMRLDMRRIAMDVNVLNNSMRALYKDLDSQFEPREIGVTFFIEFIDEMDATTIIADGSTRMIFETRVVKELHETFRKQRKLIATWYDSHVQTVKEPVDVTVANLAERKAVAKQLAHKITDRKEHLAHAKQRLPEAKNDLAVLAKLKSGLLALTHTS